MRDAFGIMQQRPSERAGEIASALKGAGQERKRLDGDRPNADSGGSCNLSA